MILPRRSLIRLASHLPQGSRERRSILGLLLEDSSVSTKTARLVTVDELRSIGRRSSSSMAERNLFLEFLRMAPKRNKILKSDNAGPWTTKSSSVVLHSAEISLLIDHLVENLGEGGMDAFLTDINRLLNRDPAFDRQVAEAMGIKGMGLITYSGVHHPKSPADFEILDDWFYATTKQTVWQN